MVFEYVMNIENISDIKMITNLNVSQDRLKKASRYRSDVDKIRTIVSEAMVRYAVKKHYGIDDINILYPRCEKPYIDIPQINFNISHAGEWVVVAVGDCQMGIDVEKISASNLPEIYKYYTKDEILFLESLSNKLEQIEWFYKMWTMKESYVKYTGKGMRCSFDCISIKFLEANEERFKIKSLKLDERHWYALCTNKMERCRIKEISIENIYK